MSGSVRTQAQLMAEFPDNTSGLIRAQNDRDLIASVPSLAPVQSVAGRTGTVTLTHTDVTDLSALSGGPGPVYIDSSNVVSVLTAAWFPPFTVNNAASGMAYSFFVPSNQQIQSVKSGAVVGGGSCPFTVSVAGTSVSFNSSPTLSGTGVATLGMPLFFNVVGATQLITITLGTITGTITSGFIQLQGIYHQ